jgi:hypothetical protein
MSHTALLLLLVLAIVSPSLARGYMYDYSVSTSCDCHKVANGTCIHWTCSSDADSAYQCFWGGSTVELEKGEKIPMSMLNVGDSVASLGSDGRIRYEKFHGWLDIDSDRFTTFVRLHVGYATAITLTKDHLIFLVDYETGTDISGQTPVFADQVQPGDRVWLNENGLAVAVEITSITYHELRGIYAPFTDSGTILVNDVLASNYAKVSSPHYLVHDVFLAPMNAHHAYADCFTRSWATCARPFNTPTRI